MKDKIIILIVVLIALFLAFKVFNPPHKLTCKDFKTQAEAMKHYSRSLDRDGNGQVCESLPK